VRGSTLPVLAIAAAACGRYGFSARDGAPGDGARGDVAIADSSLERGLVGWWKLDEGTGTSVADSSGHGNTGVLGANVTWMPGRTAGSFAVSIPGGSDNEIDLGDPAVLQLTGSLTLAGWQYSRSYHTGGADDHIVSRTNFQDMQEGGWALKGTNDCGALHFSIELFTAPGASAELCSNITPATDAWYHVAGVLDTAGPAMHIYVDGVLDDGMISGTIPTVVYVPPSVHAQIGDGDPTVPNDVGGPSTLDGLLSDVRVYTRALTAEEIAALASQ
jgi:hypothetical protein